MTPIAKYRKDENITLDELGRRLGVTRATAWKYERRRKLDAETALKVEARIGIPRASLRPDLWNGAGQ